MSIGKKQKKRGFTLVEVIVVAVIVIILAAIAIPMYSGYIEGARQGAVENLAETAAAAANVYWRKTGAVPPNIATLKVYYDEDKHELSFDSKKDSVIAKDKVNTKHRASAYFK